MRIKDPLLGRRAEVKERSGGILVEEASRGKRTGVILLEDPGGRCQKEERWTR